MQLPLPIILKSTSNPFLLAYIRYTLINCSNLQSTRGTQQIYLIQFKHIYEQLCTAMVRISEGVCKLWLLPFGLLFFLLSSYRPRSEFAYKLPCRRTKPPHPCSYPSNTSDPLSRAAAEAISANEYRELRWDSVKVLWCPMKLLRLFSWLTKIQKAWMIWMM